MREDGNVGQSKSLGYHQSTFGVEWDSFDRLPYAVRREVAFAAYEYSAEEILAAYRGYRSDPWSNADDFVEDMIQNFKTDVRKESITGVERGTYKLVRTISQKQNGHKNRIHRRRSGGAGRQRYLFPKIEERCGKGSGTLPEVGGRSRSDEAGIGIRPVRVQSLFFD